MSDVVNLRLARKAKTRAEAATHAAANRAAYGRSKAEKQATVLDLDRRARALDGAQREP